MGKMPIEDLLAKQRQLTKMIKSVRHYLLKGDWQGNCLSSGEVICAAYGAPQHRHWPKSVKYDAQLCIMLYAWMDRYYPRIRTHKTYQYQSKHGQRHNGIVWKVR